MAQVTVVVNGRSFRMGCRDGEEARVQELAAEIDKLQDVLWADRRFGNRLPRAAHQGRNQGRPG